MTVEAKKSQASQMLVTCQAERLQTEAQLASSRHPAVRSAGQQESWWGAAASSGRYSSTTALTWTTRSFKQGTTATGIRPDDQMCEAFELSFFKLTVLPTKSMCMITRSKSIDKSSSDFSSSHCSVHCSQRSRSEFFTHCTLWLISFIPTKAAAEKCSRFRMGGTAPWMTTRQSHLKAAAWVTAHRGSSPHCCKLSSWGYSFR